MSTRSEVHTLATEVRALTAVVQRLSEDMRDSRAETREGFIAVNARLDTMHTRVDTMIDTVAGLRTDFDRHTHPEGGAPL